MGMSGNIQISIIVPVHNAAETLERCIESIVSQNYDAVECILVENGSTDVSLDICREYERKYEWIRSEVLPKVGTSAARNLGLELAKGDIIGFCDADDLMESDVLKRVSVEFAGDPSLAGLVGALYTGIETTNGLQKQYRKLHACELRGKDVIPMVMADDAVMGSVCNKYYKAEILQDIFFDEQLSYCEDTHFNVAVLSRVASDYKWKIMDTPVYCYVQNTSSITHRVDCTFDKEDNLKYIVTIKKIMNDFVLDKRTRSIAKMKIASLAVDHLYKVEIEPAQQERLRNELCENFGYLLWNMWRYDFQNNVKRVVKAVLILGYIR